jgi:hypothetical protein
MFELVENDGADNYAAFNDLLPVSRDVGQVEDIVQYTDNERTYDGTGHRTNNPFWGSIAGLANPSPRH